MTRKNARAYYEQAALWERLDPADEERIEEMARMIPSEVNSIVDLGCGSGFFARKAGESRWVVGLDWSREALCKTPGDAVLGDIQNTPFRDGAFDMVVCSEVLEHLPVNEFASAVEEMDRLAKKWLLITVPFEEVLEVHFSKCADCGCVYHAHHHVRSFDRHSLRALFPGYVMETWATCGRVEWIGKLEAKIWHGIGGHWIATEEGRCPQCGSRKKVTPDRGVRDCVGLALARGVRLFHPAQKPRWLLVLMKRKSLVS